MHAHLFLKTFATTILCQNLTNLVGKEFEENSVLTQNWAEWAKKWYLYFTTNPLSGKILVLKLWAKMLLANHIAGFFKMKRMRKE